MPPGAEHGLQVRERLLSTAIELVPERGWSAVSTRILAERAGVSPSVVHYHFSSMPALLGEAVVTAMRGMLAEAVTRRIPRALARSPIPLFRAGLGFVFGRRLVMLEHIGRTSGLRRYVVLEVLEWDSRGLVIVSGYGRGAQWYRNVLAHPDVRVWTGFRRGVSSAAEPIPAAEVPTRLAQYRDRHQRSAKALGRTLDLPDLAGDGPLRADVGTRLPLMRIEFGGR